MPRPLIAVTDSPFPSLDPAKAALARIDPELRVAKSASADDILAVARDADAILVTYAKLSGDLLRQLTRCKVIGRFGLGVDNIRAGVTRPKTGEITAIRHDAAIVFAKRPFVLVVLTRGARSPEARS